VFKEKPKVTQEGAGKNLLIECKCTASPKPNLSWFKDNQPLTETNRVKSRMSGTGEEYVINLDILVCSNYVSLYEVYYSYCHFILNESTIRLNVSEIKTEVSLLTIIGQV
jgi:hypothetical protein